MSGRRHAVVSVVALVLAACVGAPSAAPSGGDRPEVTRILTAKGIEFQPDAITIPVGNALIVVFDNLDPGTPHGLVLKADPAQTITLASAPIVIGPDRRPFRIAPLVAGRYRFSCVVHPNMVADLVVEP